MASPDVISPSSTLPNSTGFEQNSAEHAKDANHTSGSSPTPVHNYLPEKKPQASRLPISSNGIPKFPESAYLGLAAKWADLYARHYESPKEFFFLDFLALLGCVLSGRIRANFGELNTQPRLFLLKVAKSAWRRKSFSTTLAKKFILRCAAAASEAQRKLPTDVVADWLRVIPGAGSAEGLANAFGHFVENESRRDNEDKEPKWVGDRRIVLAYDEFRRFERKAKGENAVLMSMVNEMHDQNEYANVTKMSSLEINDGHLVFLSNTTEDTFRELVDAQEMVDIGFLNRFFLLVADYRVRKARPTKPPESELKAIEKELIETFGKLPPLDEHGQATDEIVLELTPEADKMWENWYNELPETPTTARLDAIGMRLMGLLAFVARKNEIDAEIMRAVLDLLEYQRKVREIYRPSEGKNPLAKMQEKIVEQLKRRGPMTKRELQQHTNARRDGGEIFNKALSWLENDDAIKQVPKKGAKKPTKCFVLVEDDTAEAA